MRAKDPDRSPPLAGPGDYGRVAHLLSLQSAITGLIDARRPLGDAVDDIVSAVRRASGCDAVGVRLAEGDDYPFVSSVGYSEDFLEAENTLTVSYPDGGLCRNEDGSVCLECTCGLVLGGQTDPADPLFTPGGSVWTNDSVPFLDVPAGEDPRLHPRNRCIHVGFRSIAIVPLRAGEEILGLIHLADRRTGFFTPVTIQFYEGVGACAGMALRGRLIERDLRESEEKFRSVFATAPDAMYVATLPEGRLLEVNSAFEELFGLSPGEAVGKTTAEFGILGDPAERRSWLSTLESEGVIKDQQFLLPVGGGEPVDISYSAHMLDRDGERLVIAALRDVTSRTKARAREAALKRLLDETQQMGRVGGWEFDVDSGQQTWTDEVYRIHEVDAGFVPTLTNGLAFYTPASRPVIEHAVRRTVELGEPYDVELEIVTAKGNRRNVRAIGRADPDRRRVYGFFQDITERVQVEQERLRLERQVQQGRKLESLAVLAGGIAHDFNNLLTAIMGNAELTLAELPPADPTRENLGEIIEASHRAAALAGEMLTYSGTGFGVHERVDAAALIQGELDHLKSVVSPRARVELDLAPDLPAITGDPGQLSHILVNLVKNASEALGDEGGVVTVSARSQEVSAEYVRERFADQDLTPGMYLVIGVADTGRGMDAETQARAFEPFFSTKFVGRGLGLSAVLGIAQGHRGGVLLGSVPGEGTNVDVFLPATPSSESDSAGQSVSQGSEWKGSGTVLLVDDDKSIRDMGMRMLGGMGFSVLTAADGIEALSVYAEHANEIRVIVLDLSMPRLDGRATLRRLRALDPGVKVLLSSGYSEGDAALQCLAIECEPNGFVQKPYTSAELRATLRSVLEYGA